MNSFVLLLSIFNLSLCRLEIHRPLEPVSDAPEGWLQVCCQDNDKNDDGAISFREFTPFVLEIIDLDRKALGEIFLAGDLDRNSDLDGAECPIIRAQIRDRMKKKVQSSMRTFDINMDGVLNMEEVQNMGKRDYRLDSNTSKEIFNDLRGPFSESRLTELLLELRSRQLHNGKKRIV